MSGKFHLERRDGAEPDEQGCLRRQGGRWFIVDERGFPVAPSMAGYLDEGTAQRALSEFVSLLDQVREKGRMSEKVVTLDVCSHCGASAGRVDYVPLAEVERLRAALAHVVEQVTSCCSRSGLCVGLDDIRDVMGEEKGA